MTIVGSGSELYDSGATRHISPLTNPDFDILRTFGTPDLLEHREPTTIPSAIGRGTLVVQVPNGGTESELTLRAGTARPSRQLHPRVGDRCTRTKEGYHTHIGAGHLDLTSPQGNRIRHIPRTQGRLYKVVHVLDSAKENAVEPVSIMELHVDWATVQFESARKLVTSGAVVQVELDTSSQETDCDACITCARHPFAHP